MPDGELRWEQMRRCLGCGVLYQSDPTVYAVETSKDAKWDFVMCGKCDGKVWYVSNNGASCVSCWKCRHVNAVIGDSKNVTAPPPTRPVQAVKKSSGGVFQKFGKIFGASAAKKENAKSEGLCRSCTYKLSGLDDEDIIRRALPSGEDKDYTESHVSPPSPTSLEAMVTVIRSTEWCMRQETDLQESQIRQLIISLKNKTISEYEFNTKLSEITQRDALPVVPTSPSTSCASDKDFSDVHVGHESPLAPASKVNTAIVSNTPEQCEMSPMREAPKMTFEESDEKAEQQPEDDDKDTAPPAGDEADVAEQPNPASKVNTAIESNTPEQCEMSPMREVPKMKFAESSEKTEQQPEDDDKDFALEESKAEQQPEDDDKDTAPSAGYETDATEQPNPASKVNTAIESNTPEQCEMSPMREVPKMKFEESDEKVEQQPEDDDKDSAPPADETDAKEKPNPASKVNTAIESNTPGQCEMSPMREVPKMNFEETPAAEDEKNEAAEDQDEAQPPTDDDKDAGEHTDPCVKVNTAIESNTPEQCEMSPMREVPNERFEEEVADDDKDLDEQTDSQLRVNTAIESNTPHEAELSPLRPTEELPNGH